MCECAASLVSSIDKCCTQNPVFCLPTTTYDIIDILLPGIYCHQPARNCMNPLPELLTDGQPCTCRVDDP